MLRWWEINWKMERGDEETAKERAGHCLRRFSRVLRGGYYGEVCILILASEAATSGCGGGGWFMRHLVIIQWGGSTTTKTSLCCSIHFPRSMCGCQLCKVHLHGLIPPRRWGVVRLSWEVARMPGVGTVQPPPLVVRRTRRRPRSCLFSNVTYSHSWALSRWQIYRTEMTLRRIFNCEGQPARRNTCIITDCRIFPSLPQLITAAGLRILTDFSMATPESLSLTKPLLSPYAQHVTRSLLHFDSSGASEPEEAGRCCTSCKSFSY